MVDFLLFLLYNIKLKGVINIKSNVKVKFNPNALEKTINSAISKSTFTLKCPKCKNDFKFSGSSIGGYVICPSCNTQIVLKDDKLKNDIKSIKNSLR